MATAQAARCVAADLASRVDDPGQARPVGGGHSVFRDQRLRAWRDLSLSLPYLFRFELAFDVMKTNARRTLAHRSRAHRPPLHPRRPRARPTHPGRVKGE